MPQTYFNGAALLDLRRRRALTQTALADKADLQVRTIIDLERGRREPHPHTVRLLADALGVEVADLLRQDNRTGGPDV